MSTPCATVMVEPSDAGSLHVMAKQESARAKIIPPWTMPNPLSISSRTGMVMTLCPGSARSTVIPSHSDARSPVRTG